MCKIAFMPYINSFLPSKIGSYHLWSFDTEADKYVHDESVKVQIQKILNIHYERKISRKSAEDVIINNMMMITPDDYIQKGYTYSEDDVSNIISISHIIAFSGICEYRNSSGNSDGFKLMIYKTNSSSKGFSIYNQMFSNIDYVKLLKPYTATNHLYNYSPSSLVETIGNSLSSRGTNPDVVRILRALELFYYASSMDELSSNESRILNLTMCFEVLLDFKNKLDFARQLDKMLMGKTVVKETRTLKWRGKELVETLSITAWWGFDLYDLRNDIVHCNQIDWQNKKYGYIYHRVGIGGKFLKSLIADKLEEHNFFDNHISYSFTRDYEFDKLLVDMKETLKEENL
ncbi:protein of unknown function [Petrocella atlantisensis]|uniref:Uncharacterized protein n=1 Tax=Petrocella atlantisensis TaxID=2173034 RepID=A0A3P7RWK3_9FIRM|nr:HEPN domain-containing protein [Petrocella atlantisensis]VDN47062.1 protein of unknown function [Petrocella atlantisensis]